MTGAAKSAQAKQKMGETPATFRKVYSAGINPGIRPCIRH
jgi:hypothetical protein